MRFQELTHMLRMIQQLMDLIDQRSIIATFPNDQFAAIIVRCER
jgi:hypothetical protein